MKAIMVGPLMAAARAGCVTDETPRPTAAARPSSIASLGNEELLAEQKRVIAQAHCPKIAQGDAERAIRCFGAAERAIFAAFGPGAASAYDKTVAAQMITARKYDAGKISGQQYNDETKANRADLSRRIMATQQEEQCERIIEAITRVSVDPWISNPNLLGAVLLDRAKTLRCL
jgi:hypothetical protein